MARGRQEADRIGRRLMSRPRLRDYDYLESATFRRACYEVYLANWKRAQGEPEPRATEAPPSTVETVMYELRTDGVAALKQPNCRRRLGGLSAKQFGEVISRLIKLRGRSYCRGITDELFLALDEIR